MKKKLVLLLLFLFFQGISQSITTEKNPEKRIYYKDSIGNVINHQQFLELMKTGEYISIPLLDPIKEMEFLVRKRNSTSAEDDKYQVYSGKEELISTYGLSKFSPEYKLGDTIASICAYNIHNQSICKGKEHPKSNYSILIFTDKESWTTIKREVTNLIVANPELDFIINQSKDNATLSNFFNNQTLKKNTNIYTIENTEMLATNNTFPYFYVIDSYGKIILFVPNLPKSDLVIEILDKFIQKKIKH